MCLVTDIHICMLNNEIFVYLSIHSLMSKCLYNGIVHEMAREMLIHQCCARGKGLVGCGISMYLTVDMRLTMICA